MFETNRRFGLDAVLSVTTGRMVARDGLPAVYDLLRYMTGQDLLAPQLQLALRHCGPVLVRQHPFLATLAAPVDEVVRPAWLVEQESVHGASLEVAPATDWVRQNPIDLLCDEHGAQNVYIHRVDST